MFKKLWDDPDLAMAAALMSVTVTGRYQTLPWYLYGEEAAS